MSDGLHAGHGIPAAPQPHACSPSHGRLSCVSHTQPMSRQRTHFTARQRIGGSVIIRPDDEVPPHVLANLVFRNGGSLGRFLVCCVDDAEKVVRARMREARQARSFAGVGFFFGARITQRQSEPAQEPNLRPKIEGVRALLAYERRNLWPRRLHVGAFFFGLTKKAPGISAGVQD